MSRSFLKKLGKVRPALVRARLERGVFPAAVFRYQDIVIARLRQVRPLARDFKSVRVRFASPEDEAALQAIQPDASRYRRQLDGGRIIVLSHAGDEPAVLSLYEVGEWHRSQANAFRLRLGPGTCFGLQVHVRPDYRGSGVLLKHWYEATRLLAARGIDCTWATFARDNPVSTRSHLRLGFEAIYHYRVLRVAGLIRHSVQTLDAAERSGVSGWGWCELDYGSG